MDLSAYFAGFVDGEGCFTVSFSPRSKLLIGWEVRPSFSVSQNADRSEVLLLMQQHFGSLSKNIRAFEPGDKTNSEVSALRRSRRAHHSVLRGPIRSDLPISGDFERFARFPGSWCKRGTIRGQSQKSSRNRARAGGSA